MPASTASVSGDTITMHDGRLQVPAQPVIPFIEGDGTGVDIWPAARLVMDAAAAKHGVVTVYASVHPKTSTITLDPNVFHNKEIILSGSLAQNPADFMAAAELIGDRKIDLRPLISATYPLSQLADAFEAALRKDFYRVLVQPDAEFRSAHQRGKTAPERT